MYYVSAKLARCMAKTRGLGLVHFTYHHWHFLFGRALRLLPQKRAHVHYHAYRPRTRPLAMTLKLQTMQAWSSICTPGRCSITSGGHGHSPQVNYAAVGHELRQAVTVLLDSGKVRPTS